MSKILDKARYEEEARRKASYAELVKLENIVRAQGFIENIIQTVKPEKGLLALSLQTSTEITALLKTDLETITKLNKDPKTVHSHPAFKFNKLTEILKCTDEISGHDIFEALNGTLLSKYPIDQDSRTILYGTRDENGNIINHSGTSKPNCIQNTYFLVLRALAGIKTIQDIQNHEIYDVEKSPNIQTTKLTDNFDSTTYQDWFYFYQDGKSPTQGELLVPHLGYAFGGSRADTRYMDKTFKAEDCSSAVAKWLGATEPFTTASMIAAHGNSPECDNLCKAAKAVLTPVADKEIGYIFVFPGHTGVISNVYHEEKLLETLSYSRNMPDVEGLGYKNYSYTEKAFLFFQEKILGASEQAFVTDEL